MSLSSISTAPFVLIEDDSSKNILPVLKELAQTEKNTLHILAYEQPLSLWKNLFNNHTSEVQYHDEVNTDKCDFVSSKCTLLIDSVNQMCLCLGWSKCLNFIRTTLLNTNIRIIAVLHKDCLPLPKIRSHLNHIATAIISYNIKDATEIRIRWKKLGKVFQSTDILSYDTRRGQLIATPVKNKRQKEAEESNTDINKIATFKIGLEDSERIERDKLELPYMNKINSGHSKVYYEPDVVDDWDDEDPDDDLDV